MKRQHPAKLKSLEDLKKIAYELSAIKRTLRIGTSSLTPINYHEEMEKFFKSTSYNPTYIYRKKEYPNFTKNIEQLLNKVEKLNFEDDLRKHLIDYLKDLNNLYLTKVSIGSSDFSDNAHNLFNWGDDRLDMLLTNTPNVSFALHLNHKLRDANFIKKRFEEALEKYGLRYKVVINNLSPHIINVVKGQINIGSKIKRYECNIDRLIVHEVETHVLQVENATSVFSPFSELTKYGNQNLYGEGLAIYNEISTRKITPSAFKMYYFRIKAVRNLDKSFRELYELLSEDLAKNRAFVMTYRVKRGLSDTSKPGGFPKDASYLLGYHEIQNLVNENYPKKLLYATQSPILSTLLHKYSLLDLDKVLIPKFED